MRRLVSIVLALAITASPAVAQLKLRPAARAHLDAGLAAYDAGDYARAAREIKAAFEIDPDPSLLYTLAQAERLGGQCPAALDHYRRFLQSKPSEVGVEAANTGIALCEKAAPAPKPRPRPPKEAPRPQERPLWYKDGANAAIAFGLLGTGLGVGYLAAATSSRLGAKRAESHDDFEFLIDRGSSQRRIGVVTLTLGLGLVAGGLGYHLWRDRKSRTRAVVSSDGRSLFVAGSF